MWENYLTNPTFNFLHSMMYYPHIWKFLLECVLIFNLKANFLQFWKIWQINIFTKKVDVLDQLMIDWYIRICNWLYKNLIFALISYFILMADAANATDVGTLFLLLKEKQVQPHFQMVSSDHVSLSHDV